PPSPRIPALKGILAKSRPEPARDPYRRRRCPCALRDDVRAGAVEPAWWRSRRTDRVKILVWDGSGLVLVWKRLEQGAFKWPPIIDGVMRLSPAQLAALVEGLDWTRVHVPRIARPQATR